MKKIVLLKIFGLVILIISLIIAGQLLPIDKFANQEYLQERVAENIFAGMLLFLALGIAAKLLFVPIAPVGLIGGYLFGGITGSILAVIIIVISSIIIFTAGKFLGRSAVQKLIEDTWQTLEKYDDALERHGFITTLILRVVPTLPLSAINLGLAVTRVRTRDFILATTLGVIPGVFLLANIGERITDLTNPLLYVYAALFLLLVALTAYWGWKRTR